MTEPTPRTFLSRDRRTGYTLLTIALLVGGFLVWEIHRTIGLAAPRLFTLLMEDRVFDLAMLDFALTVSWAFLVLMERASYKNWRFWVAAAFFMVTPSIGIALFILLKCDRVRPKPLAEPTPESATV